MLRRRKNVIKTIKKLDAFPKTDEKCIETSPIGGTLSVVSIVIILFLMYSEIKYYLDSKVVFKFTVDNEFDAKLKLNIDVTVAMPCDRLGADILDSTDQNVFKFGTLEEENTWFELEPEQRRQFDSMAHINSYLREEYHAVQELLWKSGSSPKFQPLPKRRTKPLKRPDACRFYGSLTLNKVAGNFHITAGKSLSLPRGHIHISAFMSENDYNFTHRINQLSFSDQSHGILHPLEGDEKFTNDHMMLYQYFIEVVPTTVETFLSNINTYQYSVKEQSRPIDHGRGSHGMPGIFFKYDISPLKVYVRQERDNLVTFCIRLFATIGGIHIISGIVNTWIKTIYDLINHKTKKTKTEIIDTVPNISLIDNSELNLPANIPDFY